jgi:hypothetical protein
MGDRTTQATTNPNAAAAVPPSKRRQPRVLYGSSVTNSGTTNNDAASNSSSSSSNTSNNRNTNSSDGALNRSPWNIGLEYYDQRDSFTTTSSIEHDGYGIGPSDHPEEGSYAPQYQRHERPSSNSSKKERPTWMFVHEPSRNQHHNHDDLQQQQQQQQQQQVYAGSEKHHEGIWDRIKDVLHLEHHDGKQEERTAREILIDVETALARREDLDSSDIDVSVHNPHEVTLEGTVVDRHSKRIAEEVCEGIRGVRDVQNRLKIRDDDPTDANVAFVLPLTLLGT